MNRLGVRISRALAGGLTAVVAGALLTGCEGGLPGDAKASDAAAAPTAPGSGGGTSPLANPEGTKPGLAAITSEQDRAAARRLIEKVSTKGRGPRTGYARDRFGYAWMDSADGVPLARNGCDTRNDLIRRDGLNLRFRAGSDCVVIAMTLHDPYTGTTIEWRKENASEVQVDHVVPLSYSWQMGSSRWPLNKRKQFANDVLNLIPVEGRANSAKRDSGPASWLPPNKRIRCSYAVRISQVAVKYALPVTAADKRTMLTQCGG
ncbi:HNH endonuclease family protein [Streptomyces lunaelactis]|uniref:HNH endonuclease family protein n=1 Tax=Streptomyces lunaelactis TaxID=1535768 RepID=UPI00281614A0|nr:HNH endonuclease family protein [Streptomyces lunaelactis]